MGMTMTQKILAAHAGLDSVEAGQLIEADLDLVLGNDVTTPVAIHEMDKFNKKEVFDKNKIQKPRGVRGFFAFLSVEIYNFFLSTNKKFLIILLL